MVKHISLILIGMLFAAALFAVLLTSRQTNEAKTVQPKNNHWVTIPPKNPLTDTALKTIYVPVVEKLPADTVFIQADTAQVVQSYFTQKQYKQVYSDPFLDIEVTDSISQNNLLAQSVRYTQKTNIVEPKVNLWAGLTADTHNRMTFNLYVKDKRDYLYALGYSTDKAISIGVAIPFNKKGGSN